MQKYTLLSSCNLRSLLFFDISHISSLDATWIMERFVSKTIQYTKENRNPLSLSAINSSSHSTHGIILSSICVFSFAFSTNASMSLTDYNSITAGTSSHPFGISFTSSKPHAVFVSSQSLANSVHPFSLAHCSHSDTSFLAIPWWRNSSWICSHCLSSCLLQQEFEIPEIIGIRQWL